MAQHDYVIANGSGSAVRSDLNNALAAIVSQNSGATEPTDKFAYMWWADTSAGVLKLRNAANNAWITLRELDGTLIIEGGSSSAPGLYFAGDTNTGIYSPSADQVGIATNGIARMEFGSSAALFNGSGADYDFLIQGETEANLFFVDASTGRVGIGTSSPATTFDVNGDVTITDKIIHSGDTNTAIRFPAADTVTIETAGSERVRIDSSGRLLVGTSTARSVGGLINQVQIEGANAGTYSQSWVRNVAGTGGATIYLGKSRSGSVGGVTIVNVNDQLGGIYFAGADGVDLNTPGASIEAYVDGTPGANDMPGRLVFSTTADAAASPTEAMRINNAGELLVGYTADNGAYKLQVNSQIFATSATVATSDGRYKENVATLGGCLDLVKALRPVSFTWKPQQDIICDEKLIREGHNFPDGTQVGFIAQEVQEALADKPWLGSIIKENTRPAINDNAGNELAPEEQFLGIAEGNLIAVLTNALQEAIAKIETLEAKVAALEAP